MPDDVTQDTQQTQETPQTDGNATGQNGGQGAAERTFTQADVDKLIAERLEREKGRAAKAAEAARAEAERKAAEEQGEFKRLYDQEKAQREQAEARARELEQSALRRAAAEKAGLPGALADRLRGETPEEMEADAKAVLAALPKPKAPDINNGAGGGNNGAAWDEAERIRLASIYGVSAKNFG